MEDTQDVEDQVSLLAGRARPEHAIPTIVTLRKAVEDGMKIRKAPKETTWTKQFFTITHLEAVWTKYTVKGNPTYQDRNWHCNLCDDYDSTDSGRHGNTSNVNDHLRDKHDFIKEDFQLGRAPKNVKNSA